VNPRPAGCAASSILEHPAQNHENGRHDADVHRQGETQPEEFPGQELGPSHWLGQQGEDRAPLDLARHQVDPMKTAMNKHTA